MACPRFVVFQSGWHYSGGLIGGGRYLLVASYQRMDGVDVFRVQDSRGNIYESSAIFFTFI